jgi:hypothetical protein
MPIRKGIIASFRVVSGQEKGEDLFVDGFWRVDYFRQQSKAESRRGCCP